MVERWALSGSDLKIKFKTILLTSIINSSSALRGRLRVGRYHSKG